MKRISLLTVCALLFLVSVASAAILVFNPTGTYTVKSTLADANTAADVAGKTVIVTSALSEVQSNITSSWRTDAALKVEKGGCIAPTTSFTGLTTAEVGWFCNAAGTPAAGDGTTDDTLSVQRAIIATNDLFVNPITSYRTTSPITISSPVNVHGVGAVPYVGTTPGTRGKGSWFFLDHTGVGFNIVQATTNNLTGVVFEKVGTYRDQPDPAGGWTPLAADWDFSIANADVTFNSVVLLNPTKGIKVNDTAGGGYGRLTMNDVVGQPLLSGLEINNSFDTARINNVRWWPYWKDNSYVHAYTSANLVGYKFERCDNPMLTNIFTYKPKYGMQFSHNANGNTVGINATNLNMDLPGVYGIYIDSTSTGTQGTFSNVLVHNDSLVTALHNIFNEGSNSILDFVGARLDYAYQNAIKDTSTTGVIRASGVQINGWNVAADASPAIFGTSGSRIYVDGAITYTAGGGAPLINDGAIVSSSEWIDFVPVITSSVGTITSFTATGKYKRYHEQVEIQIDVTVTDNGTGSGALVLDLPVASNIINTATGENVTSGASLRARINGATALITTTTSNAYPVATGQRITITGMYNCNR